MADELLQKTLEKAIVAFHKIRDRIVYPENKCSKIHLADAALSTVIGGITFPLCLGFLQSGIFRPFRITSNLRVFSSLCGSISTIIAGSSASLAFLSSVLLLKEIKRNPLKKFAEKQPNRTVSVVVSSKDVPIYGVASLVVFKLLRGRFKSVLPSSLIHPGAFARRSLPAKGKNYASVGVKNKLAVMGRLYGCHSCGKRWRTSFVGDHIPPNMLVKEGQEQRFYPQCRSCSFQQGAALSTSSRRLFIKTHGTSLRLYHLWFPLPIPLAMLRNYVRDHTGLTESNTDNASYDETKEPDKLLTSIVHNVLIFFEIRHKDDDQEID